MIFKLADSHLTQEMLNNIATAGLRGLFGSGGLPKQYGKFLMAFILATSLDNGCPRLM